MTVDRWARAVRHQLGLGRLLPLGGARDGVWISEQAAGAVLGRAAREMRGLRLGPVRIGLADPAEAREPVVPPPPGALPPGPLLVTAEFAATASESEPLPATAARLRARVVAASESLGLAVTEVDLRVTDLLDEDPEPPAEEPRPDPVRPPEPAPATQPDGDGDGNGDERRAAEAALGVRGVDRLTGVLGRPVHIGERRDEAAALSRRHVRLELAVSAGHRALDVAREVRAAVEQALPGHPTVAVLVTAVG